MRCPHLSELPPPPPGKNGWPWTEGSLRIEDSKSHEHVHPTITVITPSFNQVNFLEEAIRSVLLQGYPNLEYLVFDGGSSDGSIEIIKRYSRWLTHWQSQADGGQSAAINKGLKIGSGSLAIWINSDDMMCHNALFTHFTTTAYENEVVYVGDCVNIDEDGRTLFVHRGNIQSMEDLLRIPTVWRSGGSIDQPAVLFPRHEAILTGGLNENNHYAMDYELWGQLLLRGLTLKYTGVSLGCFRWHEGQKTQDRIKQTADLIDSALKLTTRAQFLAPATRKEIIAALDSYRKEYPDTLWQDSGRLARTGLPKPIVNTLRRSKQWLISLKSIAETKNP